MAPKKNQQQPHKSKNQEEEELLKQFAQEAAKTAIKNSKKASGPASAGAAPTLAERKAAHAAIKSLESKKETDAHAQALQRQLQQQRLQQMFAQYQAMQRASRPILDAPVTDVEVEERPASGTIKGASCVASVQGWRRNMEDAHVIDPCHDAANGLALFAVFDGHSGVKAATMCKQLLPIQLDALRKGATVDLDAALAETYQLLDGKMKGKIADESGCTAVTVAVSKTHITCASVGDSRAVLCREGKAIPLAFDHKPENTEERARIEKAGGHVEANRVNGMLAMSRAMGDFRFKDNAKFGPNEQLVIAKPDIITEQRDDDKDEFLVVACDGVWDCFSNQHLVDAVKKAFEVEASKTDERSKSKSLLRRVTENVSLQCITPPHPEEPTSPSSPYGTDNVTLMIVMLK